MSKERKKEENLPLYSGDSFQPASNSLPSNIGEGHKVSAEYWDGRSQTGADALFGIAKQYLDFEDYAEKTRGDNELEKITSECALDVANRLSYARGHEKSFHNSDGTLKPNAVETLVRQYQKRLNEVRVTITDIDKNNEWLARRDQIAQSLQGEISKQLILNARKEGQAHFETALRLAKEKKDFNKQREVVNDACSAGHVSEDERDLLNFNIGTEEEENRKQETRLYIEKLINTNPQDFLFDVLSDRYKGDLDEAELVKYRNQALKLVNSPFGQFKELSKEASSVKKTSSSDKPTKGEVFITNRIKAGASQAELGLIEHVASQGTLRGKESYISALLYRMSTQLPEFASDEEMMIARDRLTQFIADLRDMGMNIEKEDYLDKFDKAVSKPKQKIPKIKAKERLEFFTKTQSARLFSDNDFWNYLHEQALNNRDIANSINTFKGKTADDSVDSFMKNLWKEDKGKAFVSAWSERNEIAMNHILEQFDSWYEAQLALGETPSELAQKTKLSSLAKVVSGKDIQLFSNESMESSRIAQKTAEAIEKAESEKRKENNSAKHNTPASEEELKKHLPQKKVEEKPPVIEFSCVEVDEADLAEEVGVYLPKSLETEFKKKKDAFVQFTLGGNEIVLPVIGFSGSDSVVFPKTTLLFMNKFSHEMPRIANNVRLRLFEKPETIKKAFGFSAPMLKRIRDSKQVLPPEVIDADNVLLPEIAEPASAAQNTNLP